MKNVLLIDSGSGGVNILKECVKVTPRCNFLLFCDNKNLPYGNKTNDELWDITKKNLEMFKVFFDFDIVILACNTLTSTCLQKCRELYPDVIFIGTVPAIKPAMLKFEAKDVLVLATESTIKNNITINKNQGLQLKSMPNLAREIDRNLDNLSVLKSELYEDLVGTEARGVVLGCTHYSAVKDLIIEILGDKTEVFDSADGVARRLLSFVKEDEGGFQVQIMTSGNEEFLAKLWWYYYL